MATWEDLLARIKTLPTSVIDKTIDILEDEKISRMTDDEKVGEIAKLMGDLMPDKPGQRFTRERLDKGNDGPDEKMMRMVKMAAVAMSDTFKLTSAIILDVETKWGEKWQLYNDAKMLQDQLKKIQEQMKVDIANSILAHMLG